MECINYQTDVVKCEEVIICTKLRRGEGTPNSPIRVITEVFTKDGQLIAEYDPLANYKPPKSNP